MTGSHRQQNFCPRLSNQVLITAQEQFDLLRSYFASFVSFVVNGF